MKTYELARYFSVKSKHWKWLHDTFIKKCSYLELFNKVDKYENTNFVIEINERGNPYSLLHELDLTGIIKNKTQSVLENLLDDLSVMFSLAYQNENKPSVSVYFDQHIFNERLMNKVITENLQNYRWKNMHLICKCNNEF